MPIYIDWIQTFDAKLTENTTKINYRRDLRKRELNNIYKCVLEFKETKVAITKKEQHTNQYTW